MAYRKPKSDEIAADSPMPHGREKAENERRADDNAPDVAANPRRDPAEAAVHNRYGPRQINAHDYPEKTRPA